MYCNTVLLEAIENFILANKRYVLHLCTAILYSCLLMKYCGSHNFPNNNVNNCLNTTWDGRKDFCQNSPIVSGKAF